MQDQWEAEDESRKDAGGFGGRIGGRAPNKGTVDEDQEHAEDPARYYIFQAYVNLQYFRGSIKNRTVPVCEKVLVTFRQNTCNYG